MFCAILGVLNINNPTTMWLCTAVYSATKYSKCFILISLDLPGIKQATVEPPLPRHLWSWEISKCLD